MASSTPVPPSEGSKEEEAYPEPRQERAADETASRDPWARGDPWHSPLRETDHDEFARFLAWKRSQDSGGYGGRPPWHTHWTQNAAGWGGAWGGGNEDYERTTAGPPPEWDGTSMEFKDWKLKARIWLRTTRTPPTARGPLLLKSLTKGPWQDLKHLASDDKWLADPNNGSTLVDLMDSREYYGEEMRESLLSACSRLTYHLRRAKGESARTFLTKWDTSDRKLREQGVRLPDDYLGFLLVNSLQLDSDRIKLLMNYTKGSLKVADVKEWLRVHETELDLTVLGNDKKKVTSNYMLDTEDAHEVQHVENSEEPYGEEDESIDVLLTALNDMEPEQSEQHAELTEGEAQEILLTMVKNKQRTFAGSQQAKKNRDLARGWGAGRNGAIKPGNYHVSVAEIRRRTRCFKCDELGHYSKECPNRHKNKDKHMKPGEPNKPKEMNFLERPLDDEIYYLIGGDGQQPLAPAPSVFHEASWVSSAADRFDMSEAEFAYMVPAAVPWSWECFHLGSHENNDMCATIDTGCQRMAIGLDTLELLNRTQPETLPIFFKNESHQFRSVHMTSCTTRVACIPTSLGPNGSILKPAVFEDEHSRHAPFLLSLPFLLHCRATLHLDPETGLCMHFHRQGFTVPCFLGPTGALRVCIQSFSEHMLEKLANKVPRDGSEYEIFKIENFSSEPQHILLGSSKLEKTDSPKPPFSSCELANHVPAAQEESIGKVQFLDPPPGLEAYGPSLFGGDESCLDSSSSARPSSSRPSRLSGSADSGPCGPDGKLRRREADPKDGGEAEATSSRRSRRCLGSGVDRYKLDPHSRKRSSEWSRLPTGASSSGSQHVGDPSYDPEHLEGSSDMPLWSHNPDLCDEEGRKKLRKDVLEVSKGSSPEMHFLPVAKGQGSDTSSRHRDWHGPSDRVPGEPSPGDLQASSCDPSRIQPLCPEDNMSRLRSTTRESEDRGRQAHHREEDSRAAGRDQLYTTCNSTEASTSGDTSTPSQPARRGVQGVSDVEAVSTERSTEKGSAEEPLRMTESSCPIGLRRQIFGSLKKAEIKWTEIHRLFCVSQDDEQEHHLEDTCKVIRQCIQKQQPHLKHFTELYALQANQLKKIVEVCNPDRFTPHADAFGLRSGTAFDITLGWDLLRTSNQHHVMQYIRSEKPGLVLLAPPCTKFCRLLALQFKTWYENPEKFDQHIIELRKARKLLQFCVRICQLCHQLKISYVFEHPWTSTSWNEPCLRNLVARTDNYLVKTDQCQFGLATPQGQPMRKRSGFLTNHKAIAEALDRLCPRDHEHQQIIGKDKITGKNFSTLAQRYPDELVQVILKTYAERLSVRDLNFVTHQEVISDNEKLDLHFLLGGYPEPHELHPIDLEDEEGEEVAKEDEKSFPGTHPLSLEALVKRAHEGLGHPGKERFLRILKYSKASKKVMDIAKAMRCTVCERSVRPKSSRTAAPPREVGLNEVVGCDSIIIQAPFSKKNRYLLNIVDYHSHFQMVVLLPDHTAATARWGYRHWLRMFGPPKRLLVDLGKEFKREFTDMAEADGSEVDPSSLETPEQRGFVEHNGQLFKDMLCKVMEQQPCDNLNDFQEMIDITCCMKNRLISRGGFSPAQRVFGYNQRIPGMASSDGSESLATTSRVNAGDQAVHRAMLIRKFAAQAFFESDCEQALRAAATHGPRPHHDYQTGQLVFFWRKGMDASKRPLASYWHGPARVVQTNLPTTVWVAYNGHLVKAAPEKLRPAAEEEEMSLSGWLKGISHVKEQLQRDDLRGFIDLTKEPEQPPQDSSDDFWRVEGDRLIRVHQKAREHLFNPKDVDDCPIDIETFLFNRQTSYFVEEGESGVFDDQWDSAEQQTIPNISQPWTGKTTFWIQQWDKRRRLETGVPIRRLHEKSTIVPLSPQEADQALENPSYPDIDMRSKPSSYTPSIAPEAINDDQPNEAVVIPDETEEDVPEASSETEANSGKRGAEDRMMGEWEALEEPNAKRARLEFLEIFHLKLAEKAMMRKRKEASYRDFRGRDHERLQRAIQKEVNNNLGTGAYELISMEESKYVRSEKPDKIVRSRYVITKKPLEDHAVEDARSSDEVLDSSEDGPQKAKARHVMIGFSEPGILELETTTPQVHRDSVVFAAQVMASKQWAPSYLDFTQAFHSGDPIKRELYAEIPKEGFPHASPGQLLRLRKTCYGLTDGPYQWYEHITRLLTDTLGYRRSIVDPCLFFLDSEDSTQIEGIVALATDDMFHSGTPRHQSKIDTIRRQYKLGKDVSGSGRFVGKDFQHLPDGSILINQAFYVDAKVQKIPISRERKRQRFSPCTPSEVEQLRALVGTLAWLSKETRCDLAGKTALLQQAFPRPLIRDIIAGNSLAEEAIQHKDVGIKVMPIKLDQLRVGVVTDASWGNSKEFGQFLEGEKSEDFWTEEDDTWTRHHQTPRTLSFHPLAAPNGPDPHLLSGERITTLESSSEPVTLHDEWHVKGSIRECSKELWCGKTVFRKALPGKGLSHEEIHTGYEQLERLYSQGGEMVFFYDRALPESQSLQHITVSAWKSYRLRRRTVNTLSSETQALVRGLGSVHWYRVLILETLGLQFSAREWQSSVKQLPFVCITDSKSLFDVVRKCMNPASQCDDKRISIDIALIKQELNQLNGQIRWIDGRTMIADSLTKTGTKGDYLRHILRTGQWCLLEEGAALQKKLLERQPCTVHFLIAPC